jgi:hypothetical protein
MRAPPFQDTWNVTLGGSAQDLRGEKISARGVRPAWALCTVRSTYPQNDQGAHLSQKCEERERCANLIGTGKKKPRQCRGFSAAGDD